MALIQSEIKMDEIGQTLAVSIFFPTDRPEFTGDIRGVITLLHGMSNTSNDWMTMTAAPRYAAENGLILVAPEGGNSFYQDMRFGGQYNIALTVLLPQYLEALFNIPSAREMNYIAGNSMGAYGAFYLALSSPERYAAAGSFSGVMDMDAMNRFLVERMGVPFMVEAVWGTEREVPPESDLLYLAKAVCRADAGPRPRLLATCGLQDTQLADLLQQNRDYAKAMRELPLQYDLKMWDGVHEWNFWDRSLALFIEDILHNDYAAKKQRFWTLPIEGK